MLKDITLGQYYPVDSVIHRLDPRVKLLATIIYIVEVFLVQEPVGLIAITAFFLVMVKLSHLPFRLILKGIRGIWILILLTAACNLCFTQGGTAYVSWNFIHICDIGVHNAIYYTLRLVFMVMGTSIMTLTTTPNQLTNGLETGLRGLSKIGVPIHDIAMMMSIALRFIPLLADEAEKIKKAQMARGARFDDKNLVDRVKAFIPILVPLFVSAFRRANDLALAMEARCYHGGEGRTKMKPLHYRNGDVIAYVIVALFLLLVILIRIFVV